MFTILARGESFLVNDQGEITRKACEWKFSGGWKAVALVRRNNFGHTVSYVPFEQWGEAIPRTSAEPEGWYHKNGKNKWTLRDWDHGTFREWGSGVDRVYVGDITSRA